MRNLIQFAALLGTFALGLVACETETCYDCSQRTRVVQTDTNGIATEKIDTAYNRLCSEDDVNRLLENWNGLDSTRLDSLVYYTSSCTMIIE
jgi:hypothetical protein